MSEILATVLCLNTAYIRCAVRKSLDLRSGRCSSHMNFKFAVVNPHSSLFLRIADHALQPARLYGDSKRSEIFMRKLASLREYHESYGGSANGLSVEGNWFEGDEPGSSKS